MRRIILLIMCIGIIFSQVVACENQKNTASENEGANDSTGQECWLPMEYYVHSSMELRGVCSKLSDLTSIPIIYGSYISAEEWGSSNYTAKIIFESDGVKLEQSELILEYFIGKEYQSGKIYYIPFTEETVYKDIGHINMKLQRTNDDGSITNIFEYTMYYAIKGDEVYIDENSYHMADYITEGCTIYRRNLESKYWAAEEIWIDQNTNVLYFAEMYLKDHIYDIEIEKYTYEKTKEGKYIVKDYEGNQAFTLEEVEAGVITDGEKDYKETEEW